MQHYKLSEGHIAYQQVGAGCPLLMGHSFLWDSNMWAPQLAALSKHYECIAPDLWSHGQSSPLPCQASLPTLAEHHWQLMQSIHPTTPFAVLGLSVGGMWGAHMALQHPDKVKALVLMGTFVGPEPSTSQAVYFGMMDELEAANTITPAFADKVAPYFFARETAITHPGLVKAFVERLIQAPSSHIPGIVALGRTIFSREDLLSRLPDIQVPTLVVVGDDDIPRPYEESKIMADLIPNATLVKIPQAGHISTIEQPSAVNEVLLDFLQQHM